jgi:hypothetical protein
MLAAIRMVLVNDNLSVRTICSLNVVTVALRMIELSNRLRRRESLGTMCFINANRGDMVVTIIMRRLLRNADHSVFHSCLLSSLQANFIHVL